MYSPGLNGQLDEEGNVAGFKVSQVVTPSRPRQSLIESPEPARFKAKHLDGVTGTNTFS